MTFILAFLALLLPAAATAQPADGTSRIAVLSAFAPEWQALSAVVENPRRETRNGMTFLLGRIEGKEVVLAMTGVSMVNAAMTTQMVLDRYRISRIVVSGIAGGVDPALHIGDVTVPARWGEYLEVVLARETASGFTPPPWIKPEFPNYGMSFPRGVQVFRTDQDGPKRQFWFDVDPAMLEVARKAVDGATLERCTDNAQKVCLTHAPKVRVGGNGVSGTAFVDNAAFRTYTFDTFKAQVLDMETAAIGHVAATNAVPFIAFRSLSDLAGGGPGENEMHVFEDLAADNSVRVMRSFLKALPE